ncbi:MAG: acyltransferase [Deltaproteobacteria bacterium]|nr:acyltransferase [Deltaproteobacteria bacterium]MBW2121887.1 acyltransferase [Deltaproteobacteria bacterium]
MIKVAGIQMACSEDKERNVEKAFRLACLAADRGARIICFQELFHTHWFPKEIDRESFDLAEPFDGPTVEAIRPLARDKDVVLICPIFEKDSEGGFYNSATVIDAGGEIAGVYRKVHVPQIPLWEERSYFAPGNTGLTVFPTSHGRIGIQICWDNFFPEGTRCLALKGAQIVFSPTAAAFASQDRWQTMIRANALANGVYIMRVNRVGSEKRQDFYGQSFCVGPDGEVVAGPSGMKEGIVFADVDFSEIGRYRKEYPFLSDRRPTTYRDICDPALPLPQTSQEIERQEIAGQGGSPSMLRRH